MSSCNVCGEKIVFRYVDGVVTPIHLSGGFCTGDVSSFNKSSKTITISKFVDICKPTTCPSCGDKVFFIRHNGGSVWVDELGWPWPKHACFAAEKEPSWLSFFNRNINNRKNHQFFFGIVVDAIGFLENPKTPAHVALAIDGGKKGRMCVATTGDNTAQYLMGMVVIVDLTKVDIITSKHDIKKILKIKISPTIFGLKHRWANKHLKFA